MAWETVPPPNYAAFDNSAIVGNALGNLVSNYQQAQQGQQRTQANDLRNQQDKMLLDQSKAFAGGVPMKNGMPDWPKIAAVQAEKGNVNALAALAPYIQHQQDIEGANAPDQFFPGGRGTVDGRRRPRFHAWLEPRASPSTICARSKYEDAATSNGERRHRVFSADHRPYMARSMPRRPALSWPNILLQSTAPYAVQAAVAQEDSNQSMGAEDSRGSQRQVPRSSTSTKL